MQRDSRLNLASLASPIQGWRFSEEINHDAIIGPDSAEESSVE
jgi:hypothetical protein